VLQVLRQRRWLGFTAFVVVMLGVCGALANWQWQRYQLRQVENARLDVALAAAPVPVEELLEPVPPGSPVPALPPELEWRLVTATGAFDAGAETAIRRRPLDGRNGYWIVTPLVTESGVLLVNRGWVPTPEGDAATSPQVPDPPAGPVTVTGRLRPAEVTIPTEAPPAGQAWAVDPAVLVPAGGGPSFPAYAQLESAQPPATEGLTAPLPVPGHRGLNNLVYSVQWLLFALVGVIGWWRLMRTESRDDGEGGHDGPEVGLAEGAGSPNRRQQSGDALPT
jgi:cytochrome oxidase assembly protein ShyY1